MNYFVKSQKWTNQFPDVNATPAEEIYVQNRVKPLNNGHLRLLQNLSVIKRSPLLGGNLKKIVTFGTKRFVRYSWHVCYLGYPLLEGFTVINHVQLSEWRIKLSNILLNLFQEVEIWEVISSLCF